jgi:dipeptidase D
VSGADIEGLEPQLVWSRFLELTRIPRPPKQEEQARAHVLAWAAARGLESAVDGIGNVVVRVPASPGRVSAPTVVLQAHLDMVCEREPSSPNDPREGRIEVVRDGDWVAARDTTLGADNGIGVAGALAAAEDPALEHGPLELLFTVSEEQGLDGAKELDSALVSGRLLVNLDGTSDGALTVGCAGSTHTFTRLDLRPAPIPPGDVVLEVRVSGARGGHSGGDIARGRANAVKALGHVLATVNATAPFRLASFEGGVSRNAIPRDARAVVALPDESEAAVRDSGELALAQIRDEVSGLDPGISLAVERASAGAEGAADEETTARALDLVTVLPTGVVALSPTLPGVVETSTSVNVAGTEDGVLTLASMTRSANAAALEGAVSRIAAAARLAGAEVEVLRAYPPWQPDFDSPLLSTAKRTFTRLFGAEPRLDVVHGGLECAVLGTRLPGVQMLAIGPTIENPHAPGERLGIESTQRFYRLLGALLDDLSS